MKNNFGYTSFVDFLIKWQVRFLFFLFWIIVIIGFVLLSHVSSALVPERSISVYMWSDRIDEQILKKFEKKTGIKVYVNYYESNEELLSKLKIAKDLHCDLILSSEFIVKPLIDGGYIKTIDKNKCNFIPRICPEFMDLEFDEKNAYSLPLYWDLLVLGYTKSYFQQGLPKKSWDLIFDKDAVPCKQISMVDDAREAIFLAYTYLQWDIDQSCNQNQLHEIINVFVQQKKWVGSYTDFQQGYFLSSKTYPLVVGQRERIVREMLQSDDIACLVPQEGTLLFMTNVVIPAMTDKDEYVYEFLNYIYAYQALMHSCKEYVLLPCVQDVLQDLPFDYVGIKDILPGEEVFKRISLFSNILTQKQINDVWIAFKSF